MGGVPMLRDLYLTDLPFPLASSRSFAPKASGIALDQTSQFTSDGFCGLQEPRSTNRHNSPRMDF